MQQAREKALHWSCSICRLRCAQPAPRAGRTRARLRRPAALRCWAGGGGAGTRLGRDAPLHRIAITDPSPYSVGMGPGPARPGAAGRQVTDAGPGRCGPGEGRCGVGRSTATAAPGLPERRRWAAAAASRIRVGRQVTAAIRAVEGGPKGLGARIPIGPTTHAGTLRPPAIRAAARPHGALARGGRPRTPRAWGGGAPLGHWQGPARPGPARQPR